MMKNTTTTKVINGWDMSLFNYQAGYLSYGRYFSVEEKFVARFKYAAQRSRKAGFIKFLVNNFTPEEYFSRTAYRADGSLGETPLGVLESKGYRIGR